MSSPVESDRSSEEIDGAYASILSPVVRVVSFGQASAYNSPDNILLIIFNDPIEVIFGV